jgi:hypothetical protein
MRRRLPCVWLHADLGEGDDEGRSFRTQQQSGFMASKAPGRCPAPLGIQHEGCEASMAIAAIR